MGCFQSRDDQPYWIWPLWRHMFNLSVSANRLFTFRVERKDFWLSSLLHGWYLVSITSIIGEWQNCIFCNLSSKNGFKRDMRCLSKFSTASSNKRKSGHTMGRNRLHWLKCKKICVETTINAPPTLNNCKLLLVIIICFYIRVFVNRLKLYVKIVVSVQNQFQK